MHVERDELLLFFATFLMLLLMVLPVQTHLFLGLLPMVMLICAGYLAYGRRAS